MSEIIIIKTFVRFLMAHTTHWNTHMHIWRRHRTHTHTHTHAGRPEVAVNLVSAFSHPGPSFLKDPQEQWAASQRQGTRAQTRESEVHGLCHIHTHTHTYTHTYILFLALSL